MCIKVFTETATHAMDGPYLLKREIYDPNIVHAEKLITDFDEPTGTCRPTIIHPVRVVQVSHL